MAKRRGRGEGHIEQLPSGKWRAVLSAGKRTDGGRRKFSATRNTKQDALKWLRERQAELARGELADAGAWTVADWLGKWLAAKQGTIEPRTWDGYHYAITRYLIPQLAGVRLGRLRSLHLEEMHGRLTGAGVSASEQNKVAVTLRAALDGAVKHGLLFRNVAKAVSKPKVSRKEIRPMNAEQVSLFLAAAEHYRLAPMWRLWLDAGLRPGEIAALQWGDLDNGGIRIRRSLETDRRGHKPRLKTPKTAGSIRHIPLSLSTLTNLIAWRAKMLDEGRADNAEDLMFPGRHSGSFVRGNSLRRCFRVILRRAGLPAFRLYDLRHTSATLLLSHGVDIKTVSQRLGHSDISITLKHYIHVLPQMQEKARSVMDGILRLSHDGTANQ